MSVIEATAANAGTLFQALEPHKLGVCFFWASFHPESDRDGRLDRVFSALARSFAGVSFYKVEGDQHEEIAEKFQVHVIPTFVFVSRSAAEGEVTVLDRVTGANPRDLKAKIKELAEQLQQKKRAAEAGGANKSDGDDSTGTPTTQSIASLINASHVVLFMDGIPESPKSDPSAKAVALLQECEFKFGHYDIQEDSDGHVRRALGELCGTVANADGTFIPQLFVGGKLIGNHERMAELHSDKALAKLKPVVTPALDLNSYLEQLINKDEVMLFMKGTPQEPRCGFSRKMVALLQDNGISTFGSFNILTDEAVRAGLKTYSNWPTYPQLYVKGKLVGGLDIVTEMAEDEDDLREALGLPAAQSVEDRIRDLIKPPVILFMKGSPSEPRCGFSRKAVALLKECGFVFEHFDILLDEEIRQGLKTFSNWPTFPQLYINGKLIGGLDIMKELHEDGELEELKP